MQSNLIPYNRAVKIIAEKLGLHYTKVDKVYRAYCKLIVDKIASLPLKEELTEEEFNKLVERDNKKRKLCEEHGTKLLYYSNLGIEYPYKVYEDKNELLNEILKK